MNTPCVVLAATLAIAGGTPWAAVAGPARSAGVEAESAEPVRYEIDSAHSSLVFKVKRDVAFFFGRFDQIEGEITIDADDIEKSTVEIRVEADSVYTGNERRDNHLRSPDFFDVKQFPTITFKSSKVVQAEDDIFHVDGELEIHGVKKAVQLTVMKTGQADTRGSRIGFELSVDIARGEFDMKYGRGQLADEVQVTMGIAAQAGGGGRRRRGGD